MATISCAARPKKNASGRLTEAAWVAENETSSEEIARFGRSRHDDASGLAAPGYASP